MNDLLENDISLDEIQMYQMFLFNLSTLVYETYLGTDVMGLQENNEHFIWCVVTLCNKYNKCGYKINPEAMCEIYLKYFVSYFYKTPPSDMSKLEKINNALLSLMPINQSNIELKKKMKKGWT